MILYKYLTAEAGIEILKNNSFGFSQPKYFNDPFELLAGYPEYSGDNPFEEYLYNIRTWAKTNIWSNNTGILSLTRTYRNPLMWAHYCKNHTGIVIGIDVIKAGFTDESKCLIPVQFGSVIYSTTKPTNDFLQKLRGDPLNIGHTHHFPREHEEKLNRIFLQKPMCWSYEEEVRVAKCIADIDKNGINKSGMFKLIEVDGKDLYLFEMPEGCIKELYIGLRHTALNSKKALSEYIQGVKSHQSYLKTYCSTISNDTWNMEFYDSSEII